MIGTLPVQAVDTALVMKVLEQQVEAKGASDAPAAPLWNAHPETASRLRGRIEAILDWARVRGYREGENPARWRGHLDSLLPARSKVRRVEHHAALPFGEITGFMADLQARDAVAARALEFLILTACRTSEVLSARWSEIDLNAGVWTIPATRMKAGEEHRVPLSDAAMTTLEKMQDLRDGDLVFPGQKRGKSLSNMAMLVLLRRMNRGDLTAHGFRSTFRDWCSERTAFPAEVAEAALAHSVGNKVEAAYRRGDLFEKRRALMEAWAKFCEPTADSVVVPLARPGRASP
jgi:integrase